VRTRVGYCGGRTPNPTYHDLADHTETLQVDFDPARLSYEALLAEFWEAHDPSSPPWSTQYRAAVFTAGPAQAAAAEASKRALGVTVRTAIEPLDRFWNAEDYHQKYALRRESALLRELAGYDDAKVRDSTVAARLNAFAYGFGSEADLEREIDRMGLSSAGRDRLRAIVRRRRR
jgi:peptide-methionine (S)-S-oxide reductase